MDAACPMHKVLTAKKSLLKFCIALLSDVPKATTRSIIVLMRIWQLKGRQTMSKPQFLTVCKLLDEYLGCEYIALYHILPAQLLQSHLGN